MVAQINHRLSLYTAENKVDMVIYLQMGKTYTTKTLPGEFKVTTPDNPLLSQQTVTSKGIPVPYT